MITPQVSPLELFQAKLQQVDPATAERIRNKELQIADFEVYYNASFKSGAAGVLKIIYNEQLKSIGITNLNNGTLPQGTYFLATHVSLVHAGEADTAGLSVVDKVYTPFSYDAALASNLSGVLRNSEFTLKVENETVCKMPVASLFDMGRERNNNDVDANRGMIVPKFMKAERLIEATIELPKDQSLTLSAGTKSLLIGIRLRGIATLPK